MNFNFLPKLKFASAFAGCACGCSGTLEYTISPSPLLSACSYGNQMRAGQSINQSINGLVNESSVNSNSITISKANKLGKYLCCGRERGRVRERERKGE